MSSSEQAGGVDARREAMGLFARATREELGAAIGAIAAATPARDLRAPSVGLVMLRGRMGGDGAAFNFGEATVARAVVELPSGTRGYGQRLGRDLEAVRLAAVLDALWQQPETRGEVERLVLAPVRKRIAAERARSRAETAATRVDFFTLVRGEDEK